MTFRSIAIAIVAVLLGIAIPAHAANASPSAGTVITNVATATYQDGIGRPLDSVSNTVSTTVAPVSGATVAPGGNACGNAIAAYPIGPDLDVPFTIVNSSNVTDAYKVTSVVSTAGTVKGYSFVTGSAGANGSSGSSSTGTVSPSVAPGASIVVMVDLGTAGVAVGAQTQITLVARTTNTGTVNGPQTITAIACGQAERAATIVSPVLGQTGPPVKLVDGLPSISAAANAIVTYTIGYMNQGGMPATGVVMTDPVPAGIAPQLATVTIDGVAAGNAAALAGNTLTVALGTIAPDQAHTIAFKAVVATAPLGSSLVNVATFTSTNAAAAPSTPASIVGGQADVVYDGATGSALAGSTVTLLPGSGTAQAVALQGVPVGPNTANADPFVTGADGTYGLGLADAQLGAGRFALLVTSPGYTSRRFALVLTPDAGGSTYDVTLSATDGAPLALPGSLALAHVPSVTLHDVYGIFGNLPLFKPQSIAISKSVDRPEASGGDRLVYTIVVGSAASTLGATTVVDRLPVDVLYARGTARVDGEPSEPQIAGDALTWTFPSLSAQHTIVFASVVAPGAVAGASLVNVVTGTATLPGTGVGTTSATATATTYVVAGLLSDRSVVLGRVFVDYVGDGRFHRGDTGVAKARVFLEDGESVSTDADGLFSFPAVRPGMHTLHLDPDSLPPTVRPFGVRNYDDPRSAIRLVHGVFDGGLMSDVQFAVRPK